MKRLHVHVAVADLPPAIAFYSALFGEPTVVQPDYAKWRLDDPRMNFAISRRDGNAPGVNHLGIQVEAAEELAEIEGRLAAANVASRAETGASCCYAKSDKHWTMDPAGVPWEVFHTLGDIPVYGDDRANDIVAELDAARCCN